MSETLTVVNQVPARKQPLADIINSHEARIENISSLFENTYLVFRDFHESLTDTKLEREEMRAQLQDILTQNEHLRRKDFDRMMWAILSVQDGREKEVKNLLEHNTKVGNSNGN